jgi:hypothetical protein
MPPASIPVLARGDYKEMTDKELEAIEERAKAALSYYNTPTETFRRVVRTDIPALVDVIRREREENQRFRHMTGFKSAEA